MAKTMTQTEIAMSFLCKRNPLDIPQSDYVFLLMDFQEKHGDHALEALAGFYIYSIEHIGGQKGSQAIDTTFAHDLGSLNQKHVLPRSSGYKQFWDEEIQKHYQLTDF